MKHALRSLLKSPGFTGIAVLTIALGIGANTALFSIFNRLVLSPLDLPDAGRLVRLWGNNADRNILAPVISVPKYQLFAEQQKSFSGLTTVSFNSHTLTRDNAEPEQLSSLNVTASWIPTLGLTLARGRNFTAEEDRAGGPPVTLIGYDLWQTKFGGRDSILGEQIMLSGVGYTVVGVLPKTLPAPISFVQLVVPQALYDTPGLTPEQVRNGAGFMQATARLKPGVSYEQADAEVRALSQRYAIAFPERLDASIKSELRTWNEEVVGPVRPTFFVLLVAVGLVLLIACANVSSLFLSRLSARHKEIAVRLSLGATRRTLVQQFLLETAIFCAAATALGVLIAVWSLAALEKILAGQLPANTHFFLDASTLGFTIAVSVVACTLIGLVPALQASRINLADVLKDSARGSSGGARSARFRSTLVVIEVALSVVLLVSSSLLLVSFLKLQSTPPGFNPRGVATAAINLPATRYATPAQQTQFLDQVIARLRANPQVTHAAATTNPPIVGFGLRTVYAVRGRPIETVDKRPIALLAIVTEDYFSLFQTPLKSGRAFTPDDRADTPGVAIINESFAKRLFPNESALGQVILRGPRADLAQEIVGIVGDVKANGLNSPPPDTLYFSARQLPRAFTQICASVDGDPTVLQNIIRSAVASVDNTQAISLFQTMEAGLRNALGFQRIVAWLTGLFAGVALLLSVVGLYSVLAYAVTQRTSEIGIRMALGAQRNQVITLVMNHGLKLVALGLACGLAAAAGASRLMATLLFNVQPLDPLIYGAVTLLFAIVAAFACLFPSLRASRIDPLVALRAE